MADGVKIKKTFVVKKTYQFIVKAYDRDDAVFQVADEVPTIEQLIETKCGTPKQMKVDVD